MSEACPAVQADPYAHVHKDKKTTRQKRIEQLQSQPKEEGLHHLFLYAVADDCVQCVKYWVHQGMDVKRETKHMKYTAMDWAEWSGASNVKQLLQESGETSDVDESEDTLPGGVWSAGDVKMEDAEEADSYAAAQQIADNDQYAFWTSAMSGDWKATFKEWCEVSSMIPQAIWLEDREVAPPRVFYWGLRQYLQFAKLCCTSDPDRDGLNKTLALIWTREQRYVKQVVDFVKAVNAEDDEEYISLIDMFTGGPFPRSMDDIGGVESVS